MGYATKSQQPSACQSAHERFNFRIMQFMVGYLNAAVYVRLVKEFCGDDAVQGKAIFMDPAGESDAFANWILFDKVLPDQAKRLIDLFADQFFDQLPVDEQALLTARVNDQPSIYRVFKMHLDPQTGKPSSVYRIRDLLAPDSDTLTINDRATSQTLKRDSNFIGRAIPAEGEDNVHHLLGAITELPEPLWARVSAQLTVWSKNFVDANPDASRTDFFRAHGARLQQLIAQ